MSVISDFVPSAEQRILLNEVSWDYYQRTLAELAASGSNVRVTYDRGRMELMSPSPIHERVKSVIGRMIEIYALENEIPHVPFGSMTCRREDLDRGLEPDECYYVQHMPDNPDEIDLSRDPPPDLAVEVDISRGSMPRQPIYAALGVPELWRFDGNRLHVLQRQANGQYHEVDRSPAFPDLPMDEFSRFLDRILSAAPAEQHKAVRAFQEWVRQAS